MKSVGWYNLPILEPDLNLAWAQAWYFPRQSFAMRSVGMRLSSKLTHQKPSLIMRETRALVSLDIYRQSDL